MLFLEVLKKTWDREGRIYDTVVSAFKSWYAQSGIPNSMLRLHNLKDCAKTGPTPHLQVTYYRELFPHSSSSTLRV